MIRAALATDVPKIGLLAERNNMFAAALVEPMIAGYLDQTRDDLWFVSTWREELTGFAFCEPERMTMGTWNLLAIAVAPERHGLGTGSALLQHLEAHCVVKTTEYSLSKRLEQKNSTGHVASIELAGSNKKHEYVILRRGWG